MSPSVHVTGMVFVSGKLSAYLFVENRSLKLYFSVASRFQTILRHAVIRLLAGGICFSAAFAAHATSPVGATAGSFAVSPSGAATYSTPIVMPPGTNGMQPQLSFNYISQGENGLLGMGWSVGGLSVVHRCGSTLAIDNVRGGVNYDVNDKFCLDGERLISSGSEYRTKNESWQRIVASDGTTNPAAFTVTGKDGTKMTYGAYGGTTDAKILAKGQTVIRIWALKRIQDLNGNYLTISYQNDGFAKGEYYPLAIAYTGNGAVQPYNYVKFDYALDARTDVIQAYEGGSLIGTTRLLERIRSCTDAVCEINNGLVRQYNLIYDQEGAAGRARLKRIQECGTDGVCLPATVFAYGPNGSDGNFASTADFNLIGSANHLGNSNGTLGSLLGDFNGDGKTDILRWWETVSNNALYLAESNGAFITTADFNLFSLLGHSNKTIGALTGDFDGDGKTDIVRWTDVPGNNVLYFSNGNGAFSAATNFNLVSPANQLGHSNGTIGSLLGDFNGDGRTDILRWSDASGNNALYLSNGDGSFVAAANFDILESLGHSNKTIGTQLGDFNGDGKTDILRYSDNTANNALWFSNGDGGFTRATGFNLGFSLNHSNGTVGIQLADFNGDGKTDILRYSDNTSNNALWFSKGDGSFAGAGDFNLGLPLNHSNGTIGIQLADFNGDGRADILRYSDNTANNALWFSKGEGSFAGASNFNLASTYLNHSNDTIGSLLGDFDGDGKIDIIRWTNVSGNNALYIATQSDIPDLLRSISDGLGFQTNVTYKSLTDDSVYGKDTDPAVACAGYPCQDQQNATYVVSHFSQSDGIGGFNATSYQYRGLKLNHAVSASLGFREIETAGPAGLVNITRYNQTLDGIEGTIASSLTKYGNQTLKSITNTWVSVDLGGGRKWAKLERTEEQVSDLDGTPLPTSTTIYSYESHYPPTYAYGGSPVSIAVDFGDDWSKTTVNTYENDATNWMLGKLRTSKVTKVALGQASRYRESKLEYDPVHTWRLKKEIIEPNRAEFTLTTTYGYDSFGNRISKSVNGADLIPSTRTEYYDYNDGRGQFMTSTRNALGHETSFTSYDLRTGAVKRAVDPNNLPTSWEYDGFGRKFKETRPDGTVTDVYHYACSDPQVAGSCPPLAVTAVATVSSGAGTTWVFSDLLGRTVQTNTQGFAGNYIYKSTYYDNLGRVTRVSHPYFNGEEIHCATYGYDELGRVRTVTEPGPDTTDCANTSGGRITTTIYNGLTTTVTSPPTSASPNGQEKATTKNSQGLVAKVRDNAGTTTYTYDPFGNLTYVAKDYDVNAPVSMGYDIRGRKISMNDPDMGAWSYKYNTLGELTEQTDAKNQKIVTTYDELGRMKTRKTYLAGSGTPETSSSWIYDTAALGNTGLLARGKLSSVGNTNANESYTYDELGRLKSQTATIGGIIYTTGYAYDQYSRPSTLTYPVTGFAVRHCYDSVGHLNRVENATASPACTSSSYYWKATVFDAHGRLTKENLGNGLISQRDYDHETGDLNAIKTGTSANEISIQNSRYSFDALDNLTSRSWYDGTTTPRSESFGYDDLNRLITVTGPASKTYDYFPNGNIRSKTGVGEYRYATTCGSRPHAVCSTVLGAATTSYGYDANGNMTARAGRNIAYTAFNKPFSIAGPSGTTTLTYDANFNRVVKTAGGITTTYIGKLYEKKVVSGSTTTHKHHIYAGNFLVGTYHTVSNNTNYIHYFHSDHLGSVEVITNGSGAVVQRLSYDAWGKRRKTDGTDIASIAAQATLGFTRHEHDDEVGLINMNAREYDPVLSRFISPDPLIPGAGNSQAFNRYSYTNNNPLSYTDPTGHWSLKKAVKKVVRAHKSAIDWNVRAVEKTVPYVRSLWTTGSLSNPMYGPNYGMATGDWRSVTRATATAGIMAVGVWMAPNLTALQWYGYPTYVGANMALGYASGYSLAQINGASSAQARERGWTGAQFAGLFSLAHLGYENFLNDSSRETISKRTTITGGSVDQQATIRGSLARIDATQAGKELSNAIKSKSLAVNIVEISPLNAYAEFPSSISISPEFVNGSVCCYISSVGEAPFTLDRVLAHELGHLTGVMDDGIMNMNNVNQWENYIMRQIDSTQQDRIRYEVYRLETLQ